MPDLTVEVRDRDIIVSRPSDGLSITYRKDGYAPLLIAIDDLRYVGGPDRLNFISQAWKAAYQRAKVLGWLRYSMSILRTVLNWSRRTFAPIGHDCSRLE